MPAGIRVDSGISIGTTHWIERAVLRIGSDPQCDICLPSTELDAHALTLEYRGGAYRVYNRGASSVHVGATAVNPGASAEWKTGESIRLPGDLRVSLVVEGDARPAPRPEPQIDDEFGDERQTLPLDDAANAASGEASKKKSGNSLLQMAVIGVCVLAIAGMLMMNSAGIETTAPDRPTFNDIVQESLKKDEAYRAIVRRLQYAQAALVRGNDTLARERFLKLRDQLLNQVDSLQGDSLADAKKVLSYVEYRLGQL
jgi:hypothetical protein